MNIPLRIFDFGISEKVESRILITRYDKLILSFYRVPASIGRG
jgi:hypothetical protein